MAVSLSAPSSLAAYNLDANAVRASFPPALLSFVFKRPSSSNVRAMHSTVRVCTNTRSVLHGWSSSFAMGRMPGSVPHLCFVK